MRPTVARVAARWLRARRCTEDIVSLAWVDPRGKVHDNLGGQEHGEWASRWLQEQMPGLPLPENKWERWETSEKYLLDQGWIRVSNPERVEAFDPPRAAWVATAKIIADCIVQENVNPERSRVLLTRRGGQDQMISAADFVERFGGRGLSQSMFKRLLQNPGRASDAYGGAMRMATPQQLTRAQQVVLKALEHPEAMLFQSQRNPRFVKLFKDDEDLDGIAVRESTLAALEGAGLIEAVRVFPGTARSQLAAMCGFVDGDLLYRLAR